MSTQNTPFFTAKTNDLKNVVTISTYNDQCQCLSIMEYNTRGRLLNTFKYTYDSNYLLMSILVTSGNMKNKLLHLNKNDRDSADSLKFTF